jgi:hypothetical protein
MSDNTPLLISMAYEEAARLHRDAQRAIPTLSNSSRNCGPRLAECFGCGSPLDRLKALSFDRSGSRRPPATKTSCRHGSA